MSYSVCEMMTAVLGMEVTVECVGLVEEGQIVAFRSHDCFRQAVPLLRLPLPKPLSKGIEWIESYRRRVRRQ